MEEDTWKIPVSRDIHPDKVVEEDKDTWKILVSRDIGPENNWMDAKLTRQLQEHYALKQAIYIFPMPHHPSYNSYIARTRSFEHADWPEPNPSPVSLAEAGFFMTVS
jgi:hypothetical protein